MHSFLQTTGGVKALSCHLRSSQMGF